MQKPFFYAVAALSMDGFLARYPGHKSNWTSPEDKDHLHKMEKNADVLLLARTSYDAAKEHLSEKNSIVITHSVDRVVEKGKFLTFINPQKNDLKKFIEEKKYKKICVLGGRGAFNLALEQDLLDDLYITIEPVVFGNGIGLFNKEVPTKNFKLISLKKLNKNGTVLLHYSRKN